MNNELGFGLLSIGREWGVRKSSPPPLSVALELLQLAVDLGIRWFDTAPAYGPSEAILGRFLQGCSSAMLDKLIVATKVGELWSSDRGEAVTDHSYDSMCRSIDRSIELLGRINLLQVHKATRSILESNDTQRVLSYARSCGIKMLGASVKDAEAAYFAIDELKLDFLQLPFNMNHRELGEVILRVQERHCRVLVNRPTDMGKLLNSPDEVLSGYQRLVAAFEFVLRVLRDGVVLTGTGSLDHLRQNVLAFREADSRLARA